MNAKRIKPDIDKVFADGRLIDEAIREGVHRALLEHKRAGNPIAVWRDGKVVLLKPETIPTCLEPQQRCSCAMRRHRLVMQDCSGFTRCYYCASPLTYHTQLAYD